MTDDDQTDRTRMTRQEIGRVRQRAQLILLSAHRRTVPDSATIVRVSRATVRVWIRHFAAAGPAALSDDPRSGRPRTVTNHAEAPLRQLLARDPLPVDARSLATCWTGALLGLALARQRHRHVGRHTIRNALERRTRCWRRPRRALPRTTDPDTARTQGNSAAAVSSAGPAAAVVDAAESRVQTLPRRRALWPWVGPPIRVPTPGSHTTRARVGALHIRTGAWHDHGRRRMKQEDVSAFVAYVVTVSPTQVSILMVDNESSHTAHAVADWLAQHPRLQLHGLPNECSHRNPVEPIWLQNVRRLPPIDSPGRCSWCWRQSTRSLHV